jgi:hypothetical protein
MPPVPGLLPLEAGVPGVLQPSETTTEVIIVIATLRRRISLVLWSTLLALAIVATGIAEAKKCPADSVQVGAVCIDKYEASIWSTTDDALAKRIQKGKIGSAADLAGAVPHGAASDDYGGGCPDSADGCTTYYAVSMPGVLPSAFATWFQASAACRNSGKRLATNQEWQVAAYGTPDPGIDNGTTDCNADTAGTATNTGSRASCVSDTGAFDMVGNLQEWTADWSDRANTGCSSWGGGDYGDDVACVAGDGGLGAHPGVLVRGGPWTANDEGVFVVNAGIIPSSSANSVGFRCAR